MEEIITCNDFNKIIHTIEYARTQMTYATNSVYIKLFNAENEDGGTEHH